MNKAEIFLHSICQLTPVIATYHENVSVLVLAVIAVESYIAWFRGVHIMLTTPNYEDTIGKETEAHAKRVENYCKLPFAEADLVVFEHTDSEKFDIYHKIRSIIDKYPSATNYLFDITGGKKMEQVEFLFHLQ